MITHYFNKFSRTLSAVSSSFIVRVNTPITSYTKFWPRSISVAIKKPDLVSQILLVQSHRNFHKQSCNNMIVKNGGEIILESDYVPNKLVYKHKSMAQALLDRAEENLKEGRSKWMTNSITGETLTFNDVDVMSRKVASFLVKRGMKSGDKIIYLTFDITKMFAIVIGVWRTGGVVCTSYPEDTAETLSDRVKDYTAKWLFCDPSTVAQCQSAAKTVSWPVEICVFGTAAGCTSVDEIFEDDGAQCPEKITSDLHDPILILCTSGTTGKSKGAIYSNFTVLNFCSATDGVPRHNPLPALWLLKGTHVLGLLYPLRNVFVGDHSIMMTTINKENIFKAVDKYHPFLVFGFPLFLISLVNDPEANKIDRSSIEIVCSGGIVLKDSFYETMKKLPNVKYVINGFGMTECGAITTTVDIGGSVDLIRAVPNIPTLSVGKLYPNTKLKVKDLKTGTPLGPSKQGELCVSSPILSSGYWNRPEVNEQNFQEVGGDRWMNTGDLGYYDENGFVFVVDRIKETFKYFNNHISPAELEEYILLHPAVGEACVFGMKDPDGGDHIPRAIVVLKAGMSATPEEIASFTNGKVAGYKQLRGGVIFVDQLPRGKTGKVLRTMAFELYGNK
ncbi:4-coumarate--CoA ligase 1 isoform X1 [Folsomia candida]|uniref:4-coumarate--CoA ligase 1 isoform X1 n=1 Tax=Folsomia candida TaxID=158441 RepID=UPI000B8F9CEA|nr:4-coumarate--CoA ligase 1 isoform X1 [Folsomia candida]